MGRQGFGDCLPGIARQQVIVLRRYSQCLCIPWLEGTRHRPSRLGQTGQNFRCHLVWLSWRHLSCLPVFAAVLGDVLDVRVHPALLLVLCAMIPHRRNSRLPYKNNTRFPSFVQTRYPHLGRLKHPVERFCPWPFLLPLVCVCRGLDVVEGRQVLHLRKPIGDV